MKRSLRFLKKSLRPGNEASISGFEGNFSSRLSYKIFIKFKKHRKLKCRKYASYSLSQITNE